MVDDTAMHVRDQQMRRSMLNWDFEIDPADALAMQIRTRCAAGVRMSDVAGRRCRGSRDARHAALDEGEFFGIVGQLEGEEKCHSDAGDWQARSGDIIIWHNSVDLDFQVDKWSRNVILLVPAARFRTVLRNSLPDPAWVLPGASALGALISSFMTALACNLEQLDDKAAESAVDMALDLVGSAIHSTFAPSDRPRRTSLYQRILMYVDKRLEDTDLSPPRIAAAHGISVRYLHLIFAEHGETVAGHIREKRLLRCREELEFHRNRSLTEIAHGWGFSDGAHFSRTFKKRFGLPPKLWRTHYGSEADGLHA